MYNIIPEPFNNVKHALVHLKKIGLMDGEVVSGWPPEIKYYVLNRAPRVVEELNYMRYLNSKQRNMLFALNGNIYHI